VPESDLPELKHVVIIGGSKPKGDRYRDFAAEVERSSERFEPVWLDREEPLILHYTSGSTGKPKGALHVQNAMIGHYMTGRWILDLKETDTYWCTADPGWVTGTSYGIFAPWLNGATNVIRGGRFDADAWYKTIEDLRVTVWYSAPTAFRMLMAAGEKVAEKYDLSSLRHVLSVGEPLNPEVVRWGWRVYERRIHDNWWMTETGHQLISNYPSMEIRPGSMGETDPRRRSRNPRRQGPAGSPEHARSLVHQGAVAGDDAADLEQPGALPGVLPVSGLLLHRRHGVHGRGTATSGSRVAPTT
jgi:acetyl-CoA synthetase